MTQKDQFMGFDIAIGNNKDLYPQMGDIARRYFSLDTASPEDAYEWYAHNPWSVMTASIDGVVHGFIDFLPMSSEAIEMMETGRLIEEDITPEHILMPEAMQHCKALYFAGIAVREKGSVLGSRCAAALLAGVAHLLEHVYGNSALQRIYNNPTTFSGNQLIRHLGFEPLRTHKRNVNGMDLYMMNFNENSKEMLNELYDKYKPLIKSIDLSLDQIPRL